MHSREFHFLLGVLRSRSEALERRDARECDAPTSCPLEGACAYEGGVAGAGVRFGVAADVLEGVAVEGRRSSSREPGKKLRQNNELGQGQR